MGSLEAVLLSVSSVVLGCVGVGFFWLKQTLSRWEKRISALKLDADEFTAHNKRAADSNNALIKDLVDLKDRVSQHELILKGPGR